MGNRASKQSRKLPSSNTINTRVKLNSPNKIQLQQHPSVNTNQGYKGVDKETKQTNQESSKDNKNANRIGQINIEEIPMKLDQNNPAIRVLRNKSKREEEFEKEAQSQSEPKKTVHPSVLCAIIEDLGTQPRDTVKRNYNLDDEFLNLLGNDLRIATTRIKLKDSKDGKKGHGDEDIDRLSGNENSRKSSEIEQHLESFFKPKP